MAWEEQESASDEEMAVAPPENACRRGHRRSMALDTVEGGSICLPCFAALVSDPHSPTYHVSHALSQLTLAVRDPDLLRDLRSCHAYFLVGPLVDALSVFDDEPLARQVMDLVSDLCFRCDARGLSGVDKRCFTFSLSGDFIARIADRLASGALAWSQRQIYLMRDFPIV
ncbi:Protein PRD1 [Apostasia shenzhenica]|uniref:Protein PRD1 n=1 Tax=Apostasia shenzhenica TaxID=1088818 RepID=A0A2I0AEF7_9ASPA|nr:Protein PRD1 [Apostasia shenzhenica]